METETLYARDLAVYEGLTIVRLDGFKPQPQRDDGPVDLPGEANWLVEAYGMAPQPFDPEQPGILWTDYDAGGDDPWAFALLIAADEVEALTRMATEAGYDVLGTEAVTGPMNFGDGGGVVTILQHPDGWVLAV